MEELIRETKRTKLEPFKFMVAWDGVLILIFKGFPIPLREMKDSMEKKFDLSPENSGSKFPKTTLGAQTKSDGLRMDQLSKLKKVCF